MPSTRLKCPLMGGSCDLTFRPQKLTYSLGVSGACAELQAKWKTEQSPVANQADLPPLKRILERKGFLANVGAPHQPVWQV